MIIHEPEIKQLNGEAILSSRIELAQPVSDIPETLWFVYPEEYLPYLSPRSDPFLASMLTLGMYYGENIEVRGPVSPLLAFGLDDYRHVANGWFPKLLPFVDVHLDHLERSDSQLCAGKRGLAFSGGVDSLFSLWYHLQETEKNTRFRDKFSKMMVELGLELIPVRTNAYRFSEFRIKWEITNGGSLIGCGLALNGLFSRYTVAGAYKYPSNPPEGSNPLSDHWLSTESMQVIHHGCIKSRYEKLQDIGQWPVAQENLRVCVTPYLDPHLDNCCRCDKCLRAMFILELQGNLKNFRVFKDPLSFYRVLQWYRTVQVSPTTKKLFLIALRKGKLDLAVPMIWVLLVHSLKDLAGIVVLNYIPNSWMFRLKKIFFKKIAEKAPL